MSRRSTVSQTEGLDAVGAVLELRRLALDGLQLMFDEKEQLFCDRRRPDGVSVINEGKSLRYTVITLLGLNRCRAAGIPTGFDINALSETALGQLEYIQSVGDLGLMLWLCAAALPERLGHWRARFSLETALTRFRDAREGNTTELAWLLTGLSYARRAAPEVWPQSMNLAMEIFDMLRRNQGPSGLFGYQTRSASLAGWVRGRIGCFADQVYPVYALVQFGRAYEIDEAISRATACGQAICDAQGPLGQWWWHYDAESGRCVERYPVYSVHQDGMAPLALLALSEAANLDFSRPLYKGLQWIMGANELGLDLRDGGEHMIWRSVYHASSYGLYRDRVTGLLTGRSGSIGDLALKRECRPYHLGWLLYAFAGGSHAADALDSAAYPLHKQHDHFAST